MSNSLDDIRIEQGSYDLGILGGKHRILRFDLNAFAEMERMYGSMDAANKALSSGSVQEIRRILWLGLIHDAAILDEITGEPIKYNLTVFEVGKWLTPANMPAVMEKLKDAINGSLPTNDDAEEAESATAMNANAVTAVGGDPNL